MISEPPVDPGADHVSWILLPKTTAAKFVGAPGSVDNFTEFEGEEGALVPTAFVAVTVNWYVLPLVKPVTTIGEALLVLAIPSGLEVTV